MEKIPEINYHRMKETPTVEFMDWEIELRLALAREYDGGMIDLMAAWLSFLKGRDGLIEMSKNQAKEIERLNETIGYRIESINLENISASVDSRDAVVKRFQKLMEQSR